MCGTDPRAGLIASKTGSPNRSPPATGTLGTCTLRRAGTPKSSPSTRPHAPTTTKTSSRRRSPAATPISDGVSAEAIAAYQAARTYCEQRRLREKVAGCDHNLALVYRAQPEAAGAAGDHGERDRLLHVALELCVPAALFVDAVRFTLTDTTARRNRTPEHRPSLSCSWPSIWRPRPGTVTWSRT
jgi:hypothetical protein